MCMACLAEGIPEDNVWAPVFGSKCIEAVTKRPAIYLFVMAADNVNVDDSATHWFKVLGHTLCLQQPSAARDISPT